MVGVLALVLGLPALLGSVYAVKLYRSGAATPPVTPPTSSPIPTGRPTTVPTSGPCAVGYSNFVLVNQCNNVKGVLYFRYASFICADGTKVTLGSTSSCKTQDTWKTYATDECSKHPKCNTPTPTPKPTPKPTCVPKPTCPKGATCILALPPGGWCLPTPTPKPTPTPSPRLGCGSICQKSAACAAGLICYQPPMPSCPPGKLCSQVMPAAVCRNPSCPATANCLCGTPTPPLTPTPMADCYTCNQNHQCVFGICVSGTNSCNPDALNPCPTPTAMPAPTPQPACRLRIFGFCLIY